MKEILAVSLLLRPNTRKILHRINNGWQRRPVNASVTAKQASKMLLLVRSLGVVFHSLYHKYVEQNCAGKRDGVNDDYDYGTSQRWDFSVAFSSGDVCSVCKTSKGKVYHLELESQCKSSLSLGTTFSTRRSRMKSGNGKGKRNLQPFLVSGLNISWE